MNDVRKPLLGLTMGDPNGIGPEIVLKVLAQLRPESPWHPVIYGDLDVLQTLSAQLRLPLQFQSGEAPFHSTEAISVVDLRPKVERDWQLGEVTVWGGDAAFLYLVTAIEDCLAKRIQAITTAPINKTALHAAGHQFPGHTEILSHFSNGAPPIMMLVVGTLRAVHVSTHVSLREAIDLLTPERILAVARIAHEALQQMGIPRPKLALPGLNPHAGEGGLFGTEEEGILLPALQMIQDAGIDCDGPISPDTVFLRNRSGEFDAVLALYHDQSHIPLKLLGFERGVNVTLGLPLIRTSVDHGTAFDRATLFNADPSSLEVAIDLALQLVRQEPA